MECVQCSFSSLLCDSHFIHISFNAYYHIGKSPHRSVRIYLHTCAGTSIQLNKQKQPVESSTTFRICVQWSVRCVRVCMCAICTCAIVLERHSHSSQTSMREMCVLLAQWFWLRSHTKNANKYFREQQNSFFFSFCWTLFFAVILRPNEAKHWIWFGFFKVNIFLFFSVFVPFRFLSFSLYLWFWESRICEFRFI